MFAVSNASGDMPLGNDYGFGLYHLDTRFLSGFQLTINGCQPILLSSSVDRAYVATFQLVNPTLKVDGGADIHRQTISLRRTRFLHRGLHERIGVQNCNRFPVELSLELDFDADFRDIFAVRGYHSRDPMGIKETVESGEVGFRFRYQGKDGIRRATEVLFQCQIPNPTFAAGPGGLPPPPGTPRDVRPPGRHPAAGERRGAPAQLRVRQRPRQAGEVLPVLEPRLHPDQHRQRDARQRPPLAQPGGHPDPLRRFSQRSLPQRRASPGTPSPSAATASSPRCRRWA